MKIKQAAQRAVDALVALDLYLTEKEEKRDIEIVIGTGAELFPDSSAVDETSWSLRWTGCWSDPVTINEIVKGDGDDLGAVCTFQMCLRAGDFARLGRGNFFPYVGSYEKAIKAISESVLICENDAADDE